MYARTALNRTVCVPPPFGGSRVPQNHSLGRGQRFALPYNLPKPSHTAGTLGEIKAKIILNNVDIMDTKYYCYSANDETIIIGGKMINLFSERLIIRDHLIEDLIGHHELLSDEISMKYLPDIKTLTLEESKNNLLKSINEITSKNRKLYFFRMENKITKEHIGEIGYTVEKETSVGKVVGLGYFIREKYWNKGYTTEALKRIIEFAFLENNVYRISTGCLKENKGSEKVMQKCGIIKEGEFKEYQLHENKLKDRVVYRLLKKEWKK
jgi:ribosomal-protein-alanine N-acetyltransferase